MDSFHSRSTFHTDGTARVGAAVFSELLNAVFANIGQRAVRKVARETFEQLLHMDMRFHLARQTGGLTRAIDRGTKCVYLGMYCVVFPDTAPLEVSRSFFRPFSFE